MYNTGLYNKNLKKRRVWSSTVHHGQVIHGFEPFRIWASATPGIIGFLVSVSDVLAAEATGAAGVWQTTQFRSPVNCRKDWGTVSISHKMAAKQLKGSIIIRNYHIPAVPSTAWGPRSSDPQQLNDQFGAELRYLVVQLCSEYGTTRI